MFVIIVLRGFFFETRGCEFLFRFTWECEIFFSLGFIEFGLKGNFSFFVVCCRDHGCPCDDDTYNEENTYEIK